MKTTFINRFFRVYDFENDTAIVADPVTDNYEDESYYWPDSAGDLSWLYDGDSGSVQTALPASNTAAGSQSPWLGSIHSLVQDATAILLATKGVSQQPTTISSGSAVPVSTASQASAGINKNVGASGSGSQSKNTATYIALGLVALLVVLAIVFFMRSKK